jgi:hypothetical protein
MVSPAVQAKLKVAASLAAVAGHVARDRMVRPRPRTLEDVPWAPEAVTEDWLTQALCSRHPGARVESVEISRPSRATTTRCSVGVTYNAAGAEAGLPTALFLKASKTLKTRLLVGVLDLMASEVLFFNRVRPELDIECPAGYFASYDPRRWRHCIVMEDVAVTEGAEFCTPVDSLSRAEIEDMLGILARYHARFWQSPRFDGDLAWLRQRQTARSFVESIARLVGLEQRAVRGAERYAELLPRSVVDSRRHLPAALWRSIAWTEQVPQTLMHGDPHLGQFYRTSRGNMGLLDWQSCGVGGWSFDVAYTLATALPVEERRRLERDLIALYLDRLGTAGVVPPSQADAFLAYRRALVYPLMIWLWTLNHPPLQPEMQPATTCRALIERIGAAVDDLDVLRALD